MTLVRQSFRKITPPGYLFCPRRSFSQAISLPSPIEEEQCPTYNPKKYYPARIGETVGRYRIVSKLGWGASCTAWLAQDVSRWRFQSPRYVTLKITNLGEGEKKATEEEIAISQHIAALKSDNEAIRYVRLIKESFLVQGSHGQHICLVFEPLREPIWFLGRHPGRVGMPPNIVKAFLRILLQGLDFLHSECHVIHTDLKADNFLIGFEHANVIQRYVRQQELDPAPHVFRNGRLVYHSRPDFGPLTKGVCLIKICDFSAAVFGDVTTPHNHDIQPIPFCAPEVLLKAGWTYSADIWNLGTVAHSIPWRRTLRK
ncbi:hypothetical protein DTO046C5_4056 [Penicillium roqueforti]|nr:hypothetical protein DTO046C5_4056 [Penicillium roqueforti]